MRKIAILFLLLFGSASSQTKLNRYDAKPTLALFTFEGAGMQDEDIALYTGYLRVELHKTKSFILVEKNQINELLREKKYDRMDCKTMDCAIEIGKLIGIKKAIVGSFELAADTCKISGQLINIDSSKSEKSATRTYIGELEGIVPYVQVIAWELADIEAPKDILSIVNPKEEVENQSRWKWLAWIIKPVNYIANRAREFLSSSSTK